MTGQIDATTNRLPAVFREARRIIVERGWRQGATVSDNDDRACVRSAIATAVHTLYPDLPPASRPDYSGPVQAWLAEAIHVRSLSAWNDQRSRTVGEVLAVLDWAAGLAENMLEGDPQ